MTDDERAPDPFAGVGITVQEAAEGIEAICRAILADPFLRALIIGAGMTDEDFSTE